MLSARVISVLFLITLITVACNFPSEAAEKSPPNILFLVSDDHSGADLGVAGSKKPLTPVLDRLASEGVRFTSAYAVSPQCSPSRAALITGRSPHATGTSRLHSTLTAEHDTVIDALRRTGYFVGAYHKIHLGEKFQSRWQFYGGKEVPFEKFFKDRPKNQPFFLWIGFDDPHRPYQHGSISPSYDPTNVRVPGYLPDTPEVRSDLADYYDEISRMDRDVGKILSLLDSNGLMKNTLIVFTADNGMPFPGAKGSLYDDGVQVPLIVRWPGHVDAGQIRNEVVSLVDLAPTWLDVAGVKALPRMEGESLLPLLKKQSTTRNRPAFFERNWHDNLDLIRGVRSESYLLIQNFRPELPYPPTLDLVNSPTWSVIQKMHNNRELPESLEHRYFASPRPEVELYNLESDPFQLQNLAADPAHKAVVDKLQQLLSDWMISTNDFLQPPIPPKRGAHGESIHP